MKTLDETNMFITLAINSGLRTTSGIIKHDQRGRSAHRKTSSGRINDVIKHIQSFPSYESHYTRNKNNKKYLPSFLDLTKLYSLYKESVSNPVCRNIYEREFHKMKLSFKAPKVDTCHKCDTFAMKLKVTTEEEKTEIEEEMKKHHEEADKAYETKRRDKERCKIGTSRCYTFDLQQCLPTPFVNSSVSFYKRQLWTYNLTMHETTQSKVRCYMWHEAEGGRGANQIATCLYRELSHLPEKVKNVVLYSDTCGGQNRNSHVAAMFLTIMQNRTHLEVIDHKFMVSGHSHLECDVDHGLIEKQKKKLQIPVSHPHDWYQLVRSVGKKNKFEVIELSHRDFLNFADLFRSNLFLRKKDSEGNFFKWTNIRWLRYTREEKVIYFKESLDEEVPFRCVNLTRRNNTVPQDLTPVNCYNSTLPIASEKKKDLLDLLPLISPMFHDFYKNLKTSSSAKNTYPDIEEFHED